MDERTGSRHAEGAGGKPVLICAMNFAPELVGAGRYTADIADAIAQNRPVSVVTTPPHYPAWSTRPWRRTGHHNRYARQMEGRLTIWRCPLPLPTRMRGLWRVLAPLGFALSAAPVLAWRVMRERPAVIICVEPTLLLAPIVIALGRLTGARLALHMHDLEVEAAAATAPMAGKAARRLARLRRHFDVILTLSPAMANAIVAGGVRPETIRLQPNWADVRAIARGRDMWREDQWRRAMELAPEQRIALSAGTINQKHAPHLLVAAADRLLARGRHDVTLVIVGDGPLAPLVQEAARRLPNLRWLPPQPEDALPALMRFADTHVLPLEPAFDALAMPSRLAAMLASGRPVVATADRSSALGAWIDGAAALCPPGDPDALADAICAVLDAPGAARRKSRRSAWRIALTMDRRRALAVATQALLGEGPVGDGGLRRQRAATEAGIAPPLDQTGQIRNPAAE